jgi:exodeoxyribonuclease VII large subunit
MLELKTNEYLVLHQRLMRNEPNKKTLAAKQAQERLEKALNRAINAILTKTKADFSNKLARLEALSPLKIMERGYSLVYTKDEQLIKTITQVRQNEEITVKVSDGRLECKVLEIKGGESNV